MYWAVDYAKSGRAKCRKCDTFIKLGKLRLAYMDAYFDPNDPTIVLGDWPYWYHYMCFWKSLRNHQRRGLPEDGSIFHGFYEISKKDQHRITKFLRDPQGRLMELEEKRKNFEELERTRTVGKRQSIRLKKIADEKKVEEELYRANIQMRRARKLKFSDCNLFGQSDAQRKGTTRKRKISDDDNDVADQSNNENDQLQISDDDNDDLEREQEEIVKHPIDDATYFSLVADVHRIDKQIQDHRNMFES